MKHLNEFIIERSAVDYWDCKAISKNDIIKLAKQAIEDSGIKPSDLQDEFSKYKEFDDLVRAYDNDELDNYREFENAMYNLLEDTDKYKGQADTIMDHVFDHLFDLMDEV